MVREKIKMKKIEKPAARHVTFSKRRRGLFKKAQELAILCDVQVAVIVFSSTGKLYDFSTKSMKDIIKMYNKSLDDETKAEKSSSELQRKNIDFESQEEKMVKIDHQLRLLHEKDLEVSTLNELALLEKDLQKRLCHVLEKKGQKIMEEITGLKQKGAELMEENALLRQKVLKMTKGKWGVDLSEPAEISDADKHFSGSGTSTSSPSLTQDKKDHSDTNLTLGYGH